MQENEWQPARLIDVHGYNDVKDSYLPHERIEEKQKLVVLIRPLDYKKSGWTLQGIRRELDCPYGTRFYEIKGADKGELVCEHEILTD